MKESKRKTENTNGGNKSSTDIFSLRDVMLFDRVLQDRVAVGDCNVGGLRALKFLLLSLES